MQTLLLTYLLKQIEEGIATDNAPPMQPAACALISLMWRIKLRSLCLLRHALLMSSCLSTKMMFLTWAVDDVRCLDQMVWQHLAPQLYPELQGALDKVIESAKRNRTDTLADEIHDTFGRSGGLRRNGWRCHHMIQRGGYLG